MKTDKAWQIWGEKEPYYAVLTSEKFLHGNLTDEEIDEFFASGEAHVRRTFATIQAHVDAAFSPERALDFGCGAGRVLVALANHCDSAIGVDTSDGMLTEAQKNCAKRATSCNWRLMQTQAFTGDSTIGYDFLHSHIVFQHIRPKEGERLLKLLLNKLEPGGVLALNFVYRSDVHSLRRKLTTIKNSLPFSHAILRLLKRKHHLVAPMEMHAYDLARLTGFLEDAGLPDLYLQTTERDALHWVTFYGKKAAG